MTTRRVLVVDDDTNGLEALATFIQLLGHEVRMARDGREALNAATAFQPHVIFLDIGMPELDGYEVCARLRASARSARAAIYAMTGFGSEEHRKRSARAGFDAHFLKPLDLEVISSILES